MLAVKYSRVVSHQKVKNSLTFRWPFKNKTINVYISFSFFCKLSILLSLVSNSFRFSRNFERKTFDFTHIHSFLRKLLTTTATCVRHWVSKWLFSLISSIHLVISTRKWIEKVCRKLITYKLENGIPWLCQYRDCKTFD